MEDAKIFAALNSSGSATACVSMIVGVREKQAL
jgi:hypothetical protein